MKRRADDPRQARLVVDILDAIHADQIGEADLPRRGGLSGGGARVGRPRSPLLGHHPRERAGRFHGEAGEGRGGSGGLAERRVHRDQVLRAAGGAHDLDRLDSLRARHAAAQRDDVCRHLLHVVMREDDADGRIAGEISRQLRGGRSVLHVHVGGAGADGGPENLDAPGLAARVEAAVDLAPAGGDERARRAFEKRPEMIEIGAREHVEPHFDRVGLLGRRQDGEPHGRGGAFGQREDDHGAV